MVQNLWIKNQRFILPLENFYLSKSTVSPIVTLLKCQSTWICSRWIVYSSNYWEGDNNQEYIEHASRWSHLRCNSCKVKFSYSESVLSFTWQKPTKFTMKFSGKFSVSCSSYTYDAYVVCRSSIEGKFSNFSRFTHTPIQLGWSQELLQEYLLFCRMSFHMHNLMSWNGLLRC